MGKRKKSSIWHHLKSEYRLLSKPTKKEWCKLTGIVFLSAFVSASCIGLIDALFTAMIRLFV